MGLFDFFGAGFAEFATALWAAVFGALFAAFTGIFGG